MFAWFKKYIWGGIVAVIAVLALLLGIQTQRNKALKAEANGSKETAEKASEQLQRNTEVIQQAESRRKDVQSVENQVSEIQKETAEAVETAKEISVKDTIRFGKWAIIFAVLFVSSGCAPTLSECRAAYPCPENVCIEVTPPKIDKLPRPELAQLAVSYDEAAKGFVLTPEQIGSLLGNERSLIETIKGYEKIVDVYNSWRLRQ